MSIASDLFGGIIAAVLGTSFTGCTIGCSSLFWGFESFATAAFVLASVDSVVENAKLAFFFGFCSDGTAVAGF
ncbi:hypothetical protein JG688_00006699 [Phytophthora aleatoria]|uniref:Uncharacterized protein n=1 Tax=Phytophthora aleatoria TaxID=2496075 RepID=A0A8J5IY95_9STRA|nr:hypothetical protein JG688_00006699 [Phytophthora aleatoria]